MPTSCQVLWLSRVAGTAFFMLIPVRAVRLCASREHKRQRGPMIVCVCLCACVCVYVCVCAQIFEADSEEVQREWVRFTQKIDKKLEDALRHTVKKSLQVQSLTQALTNGDT